MPEVEVICAGVTYFETKKSEDANGDPLIDPVTNREVIVTTRHLARMGEKIEVTDREAARLKELRAVQDPGSAPLPGSGGPSPTPFGTPVLDPESGEVKAYEGPVMGDPNPGAPVGGLTPEEAAAFAAQAAGSKSDQDADAITDGRYDEASVPALKAEADSRNLEIEGTGANGNVVKDDLVAALKEDDA